LDRISRHDGALNAVCAVDEVAALKQARARDEQRASEAELGLLHGLPITIKDSFEVAGLRSTALALAAAILTSLLVRTLRQA
jgi:amidase